MSEDVTTQTQPAPLEVAAMLEQHSQPLKVIAFERVPEPVTTAPLAAAGLLFAVGVALVIAGRRARPRPGACRHGRRR